jgi:hypothetical protein
MTVEEIHQLHAARRAAHAVVKAATDLSDFLERTSAVPDPARLAEYAALLAREEATRAERADACAAVGLAADSIE